MFHRLDYVVPDITREYYIFVINWVSEGVIDIGCTNNTRERLHDEMCKFYNLSPEETRHITDNLDKIKYGSNGLHMALCELVWSKESKIKI